MSGKSEMPCVCVFGRVCRVADGDQKSLRSAKNRTYSELIVETRMQPYEEKKIALFQMATELGYALRPCVNVKKELANAILCRMKFRSGSNVYQSVSFNVVCSKELAEEMFPSKYLSEESTADNLFWQLNSFSALDATLGRLLNRHGKNCAGLSRALKRQSEPVVRALATIVPAVEVTRM